MDSWRPSGSTIFMFTVFGPTSGRSRRIRVQNIMEHIPHMDCKCTHRMSLQLGKLRVGGGDQGRVACS